MRLAGSLILAGVMLSAGPAPATGTPPAPPRHVAPHQPGLIVLAPVDGTNAQPKFDKKAATQLQETLREAATTLLAGSEWSLVSEEATIAGLTAIATDAENCLDLGCHLQLAENLHVPKLLSGSVMWLDEGFVLTLRVVDVRSLNVVVNDEFSGPDPAAIATAFQQEGRLFFQHAHLLPTEPPKAPTVKAAVERKSRTEPKSGLEFAWFAGGSFKYGCEPKDEHCGPAEKPAVDTPVESFWLGKTEVTDAAFEKCVAAGACEPAVDSTLGLDRCHWLIKQDHPANCVDWDQAEAFCHWIGGDLPTAEMWEFAAKDGDSHIYPWGNDEATHERARYATETASAVGQHPAGATPAGLMDMAGNVSEWTATPADIEGYMQIRGGAFSSDEQHVRTSARGRALPGQGEDWLGFRCKL